MGGALEPVLSMRPEPVMPLVYELRIDTPSKIEFSWPEDIWQAIAASQQEYRSAGTPNQAALLESGLVSPEILEE